jgi:hypothetical protein
VLTVLVQTAPLVALFDVPIVQRLGPKKESSHSVTRLLAAEG